ncbi:2-isopropylmalate synthase [candidate division KSB1 bacterium]
MKKTRNQGKIKRKERIYIFDTTLRDGNQTDGNKMTVEQKVYFAHQLAKLKVDAIEAGFPESNETDFKSMEQIAKEVKGPIIYGLARTKKQDLDAVYNVIKHSKKPGIHTFIATSEEHMQEKLKMNPEQVMNEAVTAVKYSRSLVPNVIFSPEDATRSDWNFLVEVITNVIDAGANVVNIPDTVGFATPDYYRDLMSFIAENVPNIKQARISAHVHNDRGMATAVTIAGVMGGAREVQGTINGIGERAGNASLEQIAVNFRDIDFRMPDSIKGMPKPISEYCYGNRFYTKMKTELIFQTSRMLVSFTGNKPGHHQSIVGDNVWQHEAGIHQAAPQAYETIPAEIVGRKGSQLVIGAHSGRKGIMQAAKDLGYSLTKPQVDTVAERIKDLDEVKTEVTGEDLAAFIEEVAITVPEKYNLVDIKYSGGGMHEKTATVVIEVGGKRVTEMATGDGPVNAACNAVQAITGVESSMEVESYHPLGKGSDVQLKVKSSIKPNGRRVFGVGVDPDSVVAQVKSYISCLNRHDYLSKNGKT